MLKTEILKMLEELSLHLDSVHYSSSAEVSVGVASKDGSRWIGKARRDDGTTDIVLERALVDALNQFDLSWKDKVSRPLSEVFPVSA